MRLQSFHKYSPLEEPKEPSELQSTDYRLNRIDYLSLSHQREAAAAAKLPPIFIRAGIQPQLVALLNS